MSMVKQHLEEYVIHKDSCLNSVKDIFRSYGFLVIRDILEQEEIFSLRNSVENIFYKKKYYSADIADFLSVEEFFDPICNSFVLKVLSIIHGENLKVYPNFTARRDTYSPWHVDDAFKKDSIAGEINDTDFVQCSLFLQDNSAISGGGLDVISGSHKMTHCDTMENLDNNINVFNLLRLKDNILTIESFKGDIVVWDGRLFHRSTISMKKNDITKYSLMWTISNSKANHNGFLDHLAERGKSNYQNSDVYDRRYMEIETLASIPSHIYDKLHKSGLKIVFYEGDH